jgi:tetratricopeptide (TPR) repeat protein
MTMNSLKWFSLTAVLLLLGFVPIRAADGEEARAVVAEADPDSASSSAVALPDEQWLKTVWSQIDTLIRQEEFDLQETVVAGGVRGEEGEDDLVQHYYFKGGKRYPNQKLIEKVTERLERRLANRRRAGDRARMKYLSAICYDLIGEHEQAREYYARVVDDHAKSGYAARAQERLEQLGRAGEGR